MDIFYWILIIVLLVVAFIGLIYPIIPSVVFIAAAFFLYGILFSFEPFNWLFWAIQIGFILLLFGADYISNLYGIKKYGGTKAAIWGSTIGLLVGPFVIPVVGILIGPFIGAVIGELLFHRKPLGEGIKVGFGAVVGFFSGMLMKFIIQLVMVIYFFIVVL